MSAPSSTPDPASSAATTEAVTPDEAAEGSTPVDAADGTAEEAPAVLPNRAARRHAARKGNAAPAKGGPTDSKIRPARFGHGPDPRQFTGRRSGG